MQLYKLTEEYRQDVARLQDVDLPPEAVLDTIDAMQGEVSEKIKAVLIVSMEMEAESAARFEHAKRMTDSGKSLANRAEALRSYAQIAIQNCGLVLPIKYPEFTVNLQKNPPSCEVTDSELLPPHLKTTTISFQTTLPHATVIEALGAALPEAAISGPIAVEVKADKKAVLDTLKEIDAANKAKPDDEVPDRLPGAHFNPIGYRVTVK